MNKELFEYGVSLSRKLDAHFGMKTIAAKMTDVPGHTIAMVPILAANGIRFLHIGVNPASTKPDVPTMFWWQAAGGEKLLVMYNNDYGQLTEIGNSGAAVYFAHTGDNCGPQSVEQIHRDGSTEDESVSGAVAAAEYREAVCSGQRGNEP